MPDPISTSNTNRSSGWVRLRESTVMQFLRISLVVLYRLLVALIVVAVVFQLGRGAYRYLARSTEYLPHTETKTMYVAGDWFNSEVRTCFTDVTRTGIVDSLYCSGWEGQAHSLQIRFWGRTERPDFKDRTDYWRWRCIRHEEGFTCYAIN
jgi:hypothetical protein